ncbi:UNVERIFIED_ORG: hypothetical protein CLV66_10547 [Actinomadura viridilutea]
MVRHALESDDIRRRPNARRAWAGRPSSSAGNLTADAAAQHRARPDRARHRHAERRQDVRRRVDHQRTLDFGTPTSQRDRDDRG